VEEPGDDIDAEADPIDSDDAFAADDEDDTPFAAPTWLGALGQMTAAVLIVVAVVSLFIAAAVALRRLVP